jgi:hypothetical protein
MLLCLRSRDELVEYSVRLFVELLFILPEILIIYLGFYS